MFLSQNSKWGPRPDFLQILLSSSRFCFVAWIRLFENSQTIAKKVYPGPSLRISSSLLRLSGSLWGLLEGVTLPPLLRLGPPWSSWGANTQPMVDTGSVVDCSRWGVSKLLLSCIGLNIVGQALVLFGMETPKWKRSFISLLFCTCMHPLKKVLIWVFCAPWREMRMKVVGICRKDLNGECLVLFTTHCIRGIGHRIHPDVRLPVVRWRSRRSLEVPGEVGCRPRGTLKIESSPDFNRCCQESPRIEEESRSRRET